MIYFLQLETGAIKIGFTDDIESRLASLARHYGHQPAVLATMDGDRSTERDLHDRFSEHRYGRTEQFKPATEILAFIGRPLLVGPNPSVIESAPSKTIAVALKASPEWKDWVESFADHERLDVAKLIDIALDHYAKAREFKKEAPKR